MESDIEILVYVIISADPYIRSISFLDYVMEGENILCWKNKKNAEAFINANGIQKSSLIKSTTVSRIEKELIEKKEIIGHLNLKIKII